MGSTRLGIFPFQVAFASHDQKSQSGISTKCFQGIPGWLLLDLSQLQNLASLLGMDGGVQGHSHCDAVHGMMREKGLTGIEALRFGLGEEQ